MSPGIHVCIQQRYLLPHWATVSFLVYSNYASDRNDCCPIHAFHASGKTTIPAQESRSQTGSSLTRHMLNTPGMAHALAGDHACDQLADAPEKL